MNIEANVTAAPTAPALSFPIWSPVTLGYLTDSDEVLSRLEQVGVWVGPWAVELCCKVLFGCDRSKLNLVRVSAHDLGLDEDASTEDIYDRAISFNLELCPRETALQLWLDNPDLLPVGDFVLIGMSQIVCSAGVSSAFTMGHMNYGGRVLGAYTDHYYNGRNVAGDWIFVRSD